VCNVAIPIDFALSCYTNPCFYSPTVFFLQVGDFGLLVKRAGLNGMWLSLTSLTRLPQTPGPRANVYEKSRGVEQPCPTFGFSQPEAGETSASARYRRRTVGSGQKLGLNDIRRVGRVNTTARTNQRPPNSPHSASRLYKCCVPGSIELEC